MGRYRRMVALGALAVLAGVVPLAEGTGDGSVRIGGSTTLLPIVASVANDLAKQFGTWDRMNPGLPRQPVVVHVTGGGSGVGVKGVLDGTLEIGLISRELSAKEKQLLGQHQAVLVGKDAVAFAAHRDNPLVKAKVSFSRAELAAILTGEKKTYREIDPSLPDTRLVLLVRDAGAGSTEIVQKEILGDKRMAPDALQLPSQGALLKKMEGNRAALAYMSAGLVVGSGELRPFAFEGVKPLAPQIKSGEYRLARPLLLVVKDPPGPLAKQFIDYMLADGQKALEVYGYVPARSR